MTRIAFSLVLLAGLAGALPAEAAEVYFNGVRVTGLRSQSFKNCLVRFDAKGNVYISAKGYTVRTVDQASSKAGIKRGKLTKRYFLVSAGSSSKSVQYDVDVFINGKWVRKIRSSEGQVVAEVTGHLIRGNNRINFSATKNYGGKPRASSSSGAYLRVLLGSGNQGGGTVNITRTLVDFRTPANRTDNCSKAVNVVVQ